MKKREHTEVWDLFFTKNQVLCQVYHTGFWMGKFNKSSPKRHLVWSNDQPLLHDLYARAGTMTKQEMASKPDKLVKTYTDKCGVKRCVGDKKKLKESQKLGRICS